MFNIFFTISLAFFFFSIAKAFNVGISKAEFKN